MILDTRDDVGEVRKRVDTARLARCDERVQPGDAHAGVDVADGRHTPTGGNSRRVPFFAAVAAACGFPPPRSLPTAHPPIHAATARAVTARADRGELAAVTQTSLVVEWRRPDLGLWPWLHRDLGESLEPIRAVRKLGHRAVVAEEIAVGTALAL
jgi:hypothetical protein